MKNIKKLLSLVMCIAVAFATLPVSGAVTVNAATTTLNGATLTYTVSNGKATITGCGTSISGDVVIPDTLGGYPVTSIGDRAFYECTRLTSITIPDSVTSIGDRAFYWCTSLTSITIPDSVTSIGNYAFYNCSSLTSITIPDSVTSIGDSAFYWCTSLTSIIIGSGVMSIGGSAFYNCTALTSITIDSENTAYISIDGVLFNKEKTELICYPAGRDNTAYIIPDSVTSIGKYAFAYCSSLTSITIPEGVTSIGKYAFYNCDSLTSITIPDSVTSIGSSAFSSCTSLTDVYYCGTQDDWSKISIGDYNEYLKDANIHYHTHSGEWVVTSAPTCTENGEKYRICSECGKEETEIIPTLGHSYKEVITEPTCTDGGAIKNVCSICGDSYIIEELFPNGHSFGEWTVNKAPTCTVSGLDYRTCSVCELEETRETFATGHSYGEWTVIKEAKADTAGEKQSSCVWCGALTTQTIPSVNRQNFDFTIVDGYAVINGYIGTSANVVVPATIEGYPVKIGEGAFFFAPVENVIISEGITEISVNAFYYSSIISIKLPKSLVKIGDSAFNMCNSLVDVEYTGTEERWNNIEIGLYNHMLTNCDINWHIHSGEWIIILAPTCTTNGEKVISCTECGEDDLGIIPALGHSFGEWTVRKAPTCTVSGLDYRTCSVCGLEETRETFATGHNYGEWIVRKEPTCTQSGLEYQVCSKCGGENARIIPIAGHSYEAVITDPTCTEGGYTSYTCHCGDSYVADETAPLGHSFGEWIVRIKATCVTEGEEYRICSVCGEEDTRTVEALGHLFEIEGIAGVGEWTVRTEPDCVNDGEEYRVCIRQNCTEEEVRTISALGHSYESVITEPTCTEGGFTTYTCHCGDSYIADETAALGHTYEAVVTAPTCTEGGFTTYTCHCGDSYIADETEALGHSYTEQIIAPTRENQGYTLHTCDRCEHSYKDNFTSYSDFAEISVSSAVAGLGKKVTVKLFIKNNPGISAFVLGLDYDKTALTLESVELNSGLGGMNAVNEKIVWFSNGDSIYEGELAVLTFTVSETAQYGDYGITVTYEDGDISNRDEQSISFAVLGGNISVIEHTAGDINNDGVVNSKDLTRFSKHLALEPETVVNEAALDVNNDGFVNNKDLVCLMRYLSGDSVTIH